MHGFKSMSVNDMCASVDARRTVSVIVCRMRSFNKSTCATVRSACATIDIYIHTLPDACAAVCELMLTPPLTPALFSWTPPPPPPLSSTRSSAACRPLPLLPYRPSRTVTTVRALVQCAGPPALSALNPLCACVNT